MTDSQEITRLQRQNDRLRLALDSTRRQLAQYQEQSGFNDICAGWLAGTVNSVQSNFALVESGGDMYAVAAKQPVQVSERYIFLYTGSPHYEPACGTHHLILAAETLISNEATNADAVIAFVKFLTEKFGQTLT